MSNRNLLRTGIVGAAITAICCVTPVLVIAFGALGVSAWLGWIDFVLFALLAMFIGIIIFALSRRRAGQPSAETRDG